MHLRAVISLSAMIVAVMPMIAYAEIDTEHLFGFLTGTDVGKVGEKEIESETTSQFGKRTGSYSALFQRLAFEFMPLPNFRFEIGALASYHNISGVVGLDDRRQAAFEGLEFDLRYRLLDRNYAAFGLTIEAEPHWGRADESSGEPVDQYSVNLSILIDKELVPDRIVAAFNFVYAPQTTRLRVTREWEREATLGVGTALMSQIQPGVLIGAEGRYLRRYDSLGLDALAGQAFFLGPTLYAKFADRWQLTAAWSIQIAGQTTGGSSSLDLTNFVRYEARLRVVSEL